MYARVHLCVCVSRRWAPGIYVGSKRLATTLQFVPARILLPRSGDRDPKILSKETLPAAGEGEGSTAASFDSPACRILAHDTLDTLFSAQIDKGKRLENVVSRYAYSTSGNTPASAAQNSKVSSMVAGALLSPSFSVTLKTAVGIVSSHRDSDTFSSVSEYMWSRRKISYSYIKYFSIINSYYCDTNFKQLESLRGIMISDLIRMLVRGVENIVRKGRKKKRRDRLRKNGK